MRPKAEAENREGSQGELSYEVGDAEVTITDCDETTEGDLEIPAEIEGLPVTRIGEGAFFPCAGLTSITIPESVNSIGEGAFDGCSSITSITPYQRVSPAFWILPLMIAAA